MSTKAAVIPAAASTPSVARKSTELARLVRNPTAVAAVHSNRVSPTVRVAVRNPASGPEPSPTSVR